MDSGQFLGKTQVFYNKAKSNPSSIVKIREIQERTTQPRPRQRQQSRESKKINEKDEMLTSDLKQLLMEQNNNQIVMEIQGLAKQLLMNSELKYKKNIAMQEQAINDAAEQWELTKKWYKQSEKNRGKNSKTAHKFNFSYLDHAENNLQKQKQFDDKSKSHSFAVKRGVFMGFNEQTKYFSYKIKLLYVDMVEQFPLTLYSSFQSTGQCKLAKIKTLLNSSIQEKFSQYNKAYFIKSLKLNPQIVYEGSKQYSLSGTLELRLLNLCEGHYHIPQRFQSFHVEKLKIYNQFGSITWENVDLRKIDAGRSIKIEKNIIYCANQSLNRQCIVTFNALPPILQQLRKSPRLFQRNLIQLLAQQENCELISYDLAKGTWQLSIQSFPQ